MENPEVTISSSDRLSFTIFIAAAIHGLVILGIGFSAPPKAHIPPTFEITLASHKSQKEPKEADYQAQFNQEASGVEDQARELTTDSPAPFADTQIREVTPLPEVRAQQVSQNAQVMQLHTTADSDTSIELLDDPEEQKQNEELIGETRDIPLVSAEIASLRAKLDRQKQEYAKRPRIRRLTSVAATAAKEAEYLNSWRQKVELVGNNNFPKQALDEGIFGQLRLAVIIRTNGAIESVEILQSSGHNILDNAALQIVHLAAPFEPFPTEISKDVDQLEIIRTWRFEINGLTTN